MMPRMRAHIRERGGASIEAVGGERKKDGGFEADAATVVFTRAAVPAPQTPGNPGIW